MVQLRGTRASFAFRHFAFCIWHCMRTRYGVSPWIDTFPCTRRPDHPRLRGEHTADVVIVGGGLTGCATAYACAAAGMRPLVIEADRIGLGSAGRSAGLLLPDPGVFFRDIVSAHGLRAAQADLRGLPEGGVRRRGHAAATEHPLRSPVAATTCWWRFAMARRSFAASMMRALAPVLDARWMTGQSARASLGARRGGGDEARVGRLVRSLSGVSRTGVRGAITRRQLSSSVHQSRRSAVGRKQVDDHRRWRRRPGRDGDRHDRHGDRGVQAAAPPLQVSRDVSRADRAAACVDAETVWR